MSKAPSIHRSDLEIGEIVEINKGRVTSGRVKIVSMSENKLFAIVKNLENDYAWETMTHRLSRIENEN